MKFPTIFVVSSYILLTLASCSDNTEILRKFDHKSGHIVNPLIQVINASDGERVKLKYIEKYHPNALVCFHAEYSHSGLDQAKLSAAILEKYGPLNELLQVPNSRSVPENRTGLSIVSGGMQFNYIIPHSYGVGTPDGFDRHPCVEARTGILANEPNGNIVHKE